MDVKIAGKGCVSAGTYTKIKISGNGRLCGLVQCESFSASGSIRGESLICTQKIKLSGEGVFSQNVTTKEACVDGSLRIGGDIRTERLQINGAVCCDGLQAKQAKISGAVCCKGGMVADDLSICFGGKTRAESIKGEKIEICASKSKKLGKSLLIFKKWQDKANARVQDCMEGREISIDDVTCPRVSGESVRIGKGCNVELVQYSESVQISPRAKVGKVERLGEFIKKNC